MKWECALATEDDREHQKTKAAALPVVSTFPPGPMALPLQSSLTW